MNCTCCSVSCRDSGSSDVILAVCKIVVVTVVFVQIYVGDVVVVRLLFLYMLSVNMLCML
jgi:hypothetical protein